MNAAAHAVDEESADAWHRKAATTGGSTRAAASRRTNSGRGCDWNCHLGPFRRRLPPARPMHWPVPVLASPTDASLSEPRTWRSSDRGSALASSPAAAGCDARSGRWRQRASPTPGAAGARTRGRSAGLDHIESTTAAERDTDHKRRPENSPPAISSKPPIIGHGAEVVLKVQQLRRNGAPEGSRVGAPGPSLIWRLSVLPRSRRSGPVPRRR